MSVTVDALQIGALYTATTRTLDHYARWISTCLYTFSTVALLSTVLLFTVTDGFKVYRASSL